MAAETSSCAGKTIEHHVGLEVASQQAGRWRCAACGTTGDVIEATLRLQTLADRADRICNTMGRVPVLLVPSESPPGHVGHFCGYRLYRVQGIDRPMVAI